MGMVIKRGRDRRDLILRGQNQRMSPAVVEGLGDRLGNQMSIVHRSIKE